jgi:hypothetical protein
MIKGIKARLQAFDQTPHAPTRMQSIPRIYTCLSFAGLENQNESV